MFMSKAHNILLSQLSAISFSNVRWSILLNITECSISILDSTIIHHKSISIDH